jgi:hypothetical protein
MRGRCCLATQAIPNGSNYSPPPSRALGSFFKRTYASDRGSDAAVPADELGDRIPVAPASLPAYFRRLRELRPRSAVMGQDLLAEQAHLLL